MDANYLSYSLGYDNDELTKDFMIHFLELWSVIMPTTSLGSHCNT